MPAQRSTELVGLEVPTKCAVDYPGDYCPTCPIFAFNDPRPKLKVCLCADEDALHGPHGAKVLSTDQVEILG